MLYVGVEGTDAWEWGGVGGGNGSFIKRGSWLLRGGQGGGELATRWLIRVGVVRARWGGVCRAKKGEELLRYNTVVCAAAYSETTRGAAVRSRRTGVISMVWRYVCVVERLGSCLHVLHVLHVLQQRVGHGKINNTIREALDN